MGGEELEAEIAKSADRVMKHMNEDHGDSIKAYARAYGGEPEATAAVISGLNAEGFVLTVTLPGGVTKPGVLVPYTTPLSSAKDLHKVAVAMHFSAHNELGYVYKLSSGYYLTAAKMVWSQGSKAVMKRPCFSFAVVGSVGAVAAAVSRRGRN
jgi:hypothetical protein